MTKEQVEATLTPSDRIDIAKKLGFLFPKHARPDASGEIVGVALPSSLKGSRDSHASVSFNVTNGCYYDHGGDGEGDLYAAVMALRGVDFAQALEWMGRELGLSFADEAAVERSVVVSLEEARRWHLDLMASEALAYLRDERGLTEETLATHLIGLRTARMPRGYEGDGLFVFFPLMIKGDEVVRWKEVAFDPVLGSWRLSDGHKIVRTGGPATLFPWPSRRADLCICEGEIDALVARQAGINAVTGTGGAGTFKRQWVQALLRLDPDRVVIMYDGDEAGRKGAHKVAEMFRSAGARRIFVAVLPDGYDVNDLYLDDQLLFYYGGAEPWGNQEWKERGDPEEEEELVSALLHNPSLVPLIRQVLPDGTAFSESRYGLIYNALLQSYNGSFDGVGFRRLVPGEFVERLALPERDYSSESSMLETYARRIGERHAVALLRQRVAVALSESAGATTPDEAVKIIGGALYAATGFSASRTRPIGDFVDEVYLNLERWKAGDNPQYETTGFASLNRLLGGGYRIGKLSVMGAASGTGKTSFMLQSAIGASARYTLRGEEASILIFDIEMKGDEIVERAASQIAGVDLQQLRQGRASEASVVDFERALEKVRRTVLYVDDSDDVTLDYVEAVAAQVDARAPLKLICLDYLELVKHRAETEELRVGGIATGLRRIASRFNVPVLCLSQLNEDYLNKAPSPYVPSAKHLRYSRKIEHEAYLILLLHWPDYIRRVKGIAPTSKDEAMADFTYDPDEKGKAAIIVGKNRQGLTGHVRIRFHPETTFFEDPEDVAMGTTVRQKPTMLPDVAPF